MNGREGFGHSTVVVNRIGDGVLPYRVDFTHVTERSGLRRVSGVAFFFFRVYKFRP